MTHWCAVRTHARAEDKAAFHLGRQGYDVFLPKHLKRRRHARRVEWLPAPLFPRYLFVLLEQGVTAWRAIVSTIGVADLVSFDGRPAVVPRDVIEDIKNRQDEKGLVSTGLDKLKKGDNVKLIEGPLQGLDALFECENDDDRVTVLISLMGRRVKVRTEKESVYKAA